MINCDAEMFSPFSIIKKLTPQIFNSKENGDCWVISFQTKTGTYLARNTTESSLS